MESPILELLDQRMLRGIDMRLCLHLLLGEIGSLVVALADQCCLASRRERTL